MENWEGGTYTAKVPKGTAIAGSGLPRPQKIGSQSPRCHACDWSLRRPFHLKIILGQIDTDSDKLLLPLCGTPATTPWHYDAVEERPSTSSSPSRPRRRTHRLRRIGFVARLGSQAHRSGASHQRAGRRRRRGAARLGKAHRRAIAVRQDMGTARRRIIRECCYRDAASFDAAIFSPGAWMRGSFAHLKGTPSPTSISPPPNSGLPRN